MDIDPKENIDLCTGVEPEQVLIKCENHSNNDSETYEESEENTQRSLDDTQTVEQSDSDELNSNVLDAEMPYESEVNLVEATSLNNLPAGDHKIPCQTQQNGKIGQYQLINYGGLKLVHLNVPKQGLNDYLVMNSKIENKPDTADYRVWAADATKILINLYKKYRNSVGSTEIKTWKRCWDVIAMDINTKVPHMKVSGSHVENRWRVLERNYRKYLNNQNKNGRMRKHFDYADEFDEIFGKKKNPYLLLIKTTSNASEQNGANLKTSRETATIQSEAKLIPIRQSQSIPAKTEKKETVTTLTENRQKCKMIRKRSTRSNILLNMRKDRLYYYKQRLEIEKTKMELVKEKVSIMKVKNLLIKERNDILSKFTKNTLFTEACS